MVFHFCKRSDKNKLERVQERALRAVFQDKTSCYEELLVKANLHTLNNKCLQDITILMYKVKNELAPKSLQCLFERQITGYNLRNSDFKLPDYKTVRFGKHSIKYLGPILWSKIAQDIRNSQSLQIYKTRIRKEEDISRLVTFSCKNCKLCN